MREAMRKAKIKSMGIQNTQDRLIIRETRPTQTIHTIRQLRVQAFHYGGKTATCLVARSPRLFTIQATVFAGRFSQKSRCIPLVGSSLLFFSHTVVCLFSISSNPYSLSCLRHACTCLTKGTRDLFVATRPITGLVHSLPPPTLHSSKTAHTLHRDRRTQRRAGGKKISLYSEIPIRPLSIQPPGTKAQTLPSPTSHSPQTGSQRRQWVTDLDATGHHCIGLFPPMRLRRHSARKAFVPLPCKAHTHGTHAHHPGPSATAHTPSPPLPDDSRALPFPSPTPHPHMLAIASSLPLPRRSRRPSRALPPIAFQFHHHPPPQPCVSFPSSSPPSPSSVPWPPPRYVLFSCLSVG